MSELKNRGPQGSEERAGKESVSSTPNKGAVVEAQPTIDSGVVGTGFWVGDGADIRFVEKSADDNRAEYDAAQTRESLANQQKRHEEMKPENIAELDDNNRRREQIRKAHDGPKERAAAETAKNLGGF